MTVRSFVCLAADHLEDDLVVGSGGADGVEQLPDRGHLLLADRDDQVADQQPSFGRRPLGAHGRHANAALHFLGLISKSGVRPAGRGRPGPFAQQDREGERFAVALQFEDDLVAGLRLLDRRAELVGCLDAGRLRFL